ncbi:AAA family ATPase [Anabaena sp. CCY 0017]|uniref:AAA family ATPase n=1 Tax=Anabaena sp. CCY 0017 TaxID=3103866 RepID=UPI0039C64A3F
MLKQLILENWKSFRYAELPLDPLTVLIGTNASGKSNVVEALEFLQRIAQGENIEAALAGDKTLASIRGGVDWAARKPESQFTLKVLMQGEDETTDYLYVIQIKTQPEVRVLGEYIEVHILHKNSELEQLNSFTFKSYTSGIKSGLKSVGSGVNLIELEQFDLFFAKGITLDKNGGNYLNNDYLSFKIKIALFVISILEKTFILNPIPSKMRDYSRLSDTLESDASNIAGVLAALSDQEKEEVESALSNYIKDLPEGDIKKVWAEKVGRFGTDAMLYCQEEWKPGEITEIDARSMSDGTLRFLAILTALLTRPEGSQLVIEEIDNGLHPSRAKLLVKILREIGSKRNIDILITTHNPALLDALGPEIVPFVVVAHRDSETGESKLSILEEIDNLPLLLASGTLGKLATKGAIEKSLSENK